MKHFSISIIAIAFLLAVSVLSVAPTAQAQRPTPTTIPTATTVTTGASTTSQPAVAPKTGVVSGYVVDYSSAGAPQAGIPVVLDGGGWSLETMSDSNGFFQFMGLGDGTARLSLKLPPDAHAVNPEWNVNTAGDTANMGFYWGDWPLPVMLVMDSTELNIGAGETKAFSVGVKNQSGGDATNITLEIVLPDDLTPGAARASIGEAEISGNTIMGKIDSLPTGETAIFTVSATAADKLGENALSADVNLVYDQQYSPQRLGVKWQPSAGTADATAAKSGEALPETGNEGSMPTSPWPLVLLSLILIAGLAYAGVRTVARSTK